MIYAGFKNLLQKTASDEVLCNKVFNYVKNAKYNGYQRGFASMFYNFFDKQSDTHNRREINSDAFFDNQQLVKE